MASYVAGSNNGLFRALSISKVLAATHVVTAVLIGIGVWLLFRALRKKRNENRHEGLGGALTAGLVPCPLTLFVVVAALSRGVPEAGLVFAGSMLIGIALTLGLVAVVAVLGRQTLLNFLSRRGGGLRHLSRALDAVAGVLIILFASRDLLQ